MKRYFVALVLVGSACLAADLVAPRKTKPVVTSIRSITKVNNRVNITMLAWHNGAESEEVNIQLTPTTAKRLMIDLRKYFDETASDK